MIGAGVDLNLLDNKHNSALSVSAYKGHLEIIKLLVQAGVDPRKTSSGYDSALINAVFDGHSEITDFLLR